MADLNDIRKQLDAIDTRLIEALADRHRIVEQVAALKASNGRAIRDMLREEQIIARLGQRAREYGLNNYFVTSVFQKIIDYSVRYQMAYITDDANTQAAEQVRVAYQGAEGGYSHQAAQQHFSMRNVDLVCHGYVTMDEALDAVARGVADYAVLPIENTAAGSINETYDLLAQTKLALVGEEVLQVAYCLAAIADVPLHQIRRISSHPQAIAMCSPFLSTLDDVRVDTYLDTVLAARQIHEDNDLAHAAIASVAAAERYGLHILKRDITKARDNYTRYVFIAREPVTYDARIPCKTSLIFATPHTPGALMACLNVLSEHELNVAKLESRPRPKTPWEYLFYVDVEGNRADAHVEAGLNTLAQTALYLKVLGSYPARTSNQDATAPPAVPPLIAKHTTPAIHTRTKAAHLALRQPNQGDTLVRLGNIVVGGDKPVLIAGPTVWDTPATIRACAEAVADVGGHVLRGNCFDETPQTRTLGRAGLEALRQAGAAHNLPVLTNVIDPQDVATVAREADVLQVGTHDMQHRALLREVGQTDRPVLLKRGRMATVDEWLDAAAAIMAHGNRQIILCERGVRGYEQGPRQTLDLSAIPLLRERTHLPILVNPSTTFPHTQALPLARAALAAGAHGVLLDIAPVSSRPEALPLTTLREFADQYHQLAAYLTNIPQ